MWLCNSVFPTETWQSNPSCNHFPKELYGFSEVQEDALCFALVNFMFSESLLQDHCRSGQSDRAH